MPKHEYVEYIIDLLAPLGGIRYRSMFGGYGLYKDGVIFAIIDEDELYFKVDNSNKPLYIEMNSTPFTYQGKNGQPVSMSYWKIPLNVLDDEERLQELACLSYEVSLKSKKPPHKKAKINK